MRNILFVILLLATLFASCKKQEGQTQKVVVRNSDLKADSIIDDIRTRHQIHYRLDTVSKRWSYSLFYQLKLKNGDRHLIELTTFDIDDIYQRNEQFFLTFSNGPFRSIIYRLELASRDLELLSSLTSAKIFLVVNISRVKKMDFEFESDITDSDPEVDHYIIDFGLTGSRKVIAEGQILEVHVIEE